jgi:MtN3 and saliva related transmembrane protein
MTSIENILGTVAFVTTIIGLLPQSYKALRTKSMKDVSMLMLANCLLCSASWTLYGLYVGSSYVVWSNVFSVLISIASISQKLYYDRRTA